MYQSFSSLSELQNVHIEWPCDLSGLPYSKYSKPPSNSALKLRKKSIETTTTKNDSGTKQLKINRTYAVSNNFNCPYIESNGSLRSSFGRRLSRRRGTLLDITEFLSEVECVGEQMSDVECMNRQCEESYVSSCSSLGKSLSESRGTTLTYIKLSTDKKHLEKGLIGETCTNCQCKESSGLTLSSFGKGLRKRHSKLLNFTEFLAEAEWMGSETSDADCINCKFTDSTGSTWSLFGKKSQQPSRHITVKSLI